MLHFVFSFGINSSKITYIIVPAAKDSIYGIIGVTKLVKRIVIKAPIGSTIPESTPYIKE